MCRRRSGRDLGPPTATPGRTRSQFVDALSPARRPTTSRLAARRIWRRSTCAPMGQGRSALPACALPRRGGAGGPPRRLLGCARLPAAGGMEARPVAGGGGSCPGSVGEARACMLDESCVAAGARNHARLRVTIGHTRSTSLRLVAMRGDHRAELVPLEVGPFSTRFAPHFPARSRLKYGDVECGGTTGRQRDTSAQCQRLRHWQPWSGHHDHHFHHPP